MSIAVASVLQSEVKARKGTEKLTQRALADAVHVSQSQMSKYLRGERSLNIDELDAICTRLGLSIVDVVSRADELRHGRGKL